MKTDRRRSSDRPRGERGQAAPLVLVALLFAALLAATIVRFEHIGSDVRVTLERRGASATARARWQPTPIP